MSFTLPFLLGHVFFAPPSHSLVDYHLPSGGMPLHDVVWANYEKDITAENQAHGLRGVYWRIVYA